MSKFVKKVVNVGRKIVNKVVNVVTSIVGDVISWFIDVPDQPNLEAGKFPRSCCPAILKPSSNGVMNSRLHGRKNAGRIYWKGINYA